MSFTIENDKQNRMSFFDVQIIYQDKTFLTSASHKPNFSGVYTHFVNFLPSTYTLGAVYTLAYRCFQIYSNWTKLKTKLVCLK